MVPIVSFLVVSIPRALAITLSPARIELSGDSGTIITKDITLYNNNKNSPETYYVSYANFEAQGETGSPRFVEPKSDLGTWMSMGAESYTLGPEESKTIPLKITIPDDAYAGGHFAVVFFGTNPNNPETGGQVSVGAKTGILILLSVNGDVLEAGGLSDFKTENDKFFYNTLPVDFQYRFRNDGNDRVKPEGNIIIHNMLYIPVSHIDANKVSGNILPHSSRLFDVEWIKNPRDEKINVPDSIMSSYFDQANYQWKNFAVGLYVANLKLAYGSTDNHDSKYTFFFVFPWQLLIIIFIALITILFIGGKLIRRYNRYIIRKARISMNTPNDVIHG